MKKHFSVLKNIYFCFAMLAMFFVACSTMFVYKMTANATTAFYGTKSITVTNGNFTSYSSNTKGTPYAISSGWTKYLGSNAIAGVIDTDESEFNSTDHSKFTLQANPETDETINDADSKILMIKATSGSTRFGYESESISLESNKYYVISVHCKTGLKDPDTQEIIDGTDATASIYTTLSNTIKFDGITTNGTWKTFKLFVATNNETELSFKINLILGGKDSSSGVVFFDNVEVFEIANLDYFSSLEDGYYEKRIEFPSNIITGFSNNDFEDDMNGWEIAESTGNISVKNNASINSLISEIEEKEDNYADNYIADNSKSLFILNTSEAYSSVSTTSENLITIEQHKYYMLSVINIYFSW